MWGQQSTSAGKARGHPLVTEAQCLILVSFNDITSLLFTKYKMEAEMPICPASHTSQDQDGAPPALSKPAGRQGEQSLGPCLGPDSALPPVSVAGAQRVGERGAREAEVPGLPQGPGSTGPTSRLPHLPWDPRNSQGLLWALLDLRP